MKLPLQTKPIIRKKLYSEAFYLNNKIIYFSQFEIDPVIQFNGELACSLCCSEALSDDEKMACEENLFSCTCD